MKKIRTVVALGVVFGTGYYFDEIRQILPTIGRNGVAEHVRDGEREIRKEFLDAKSRFLDGRAKILDGNYEKARAELEETLRHLKTAKRRGAETSQELLNGLMARITRLQQSLTDGKKITADRLREAQDTLDELLDRDG